MKNFDFLILLKKIHKTYEFFSSGSLNLLQFFFYKYM